MCGHVLPGMADIILSCQLTPPAGCPTEIDEALVRAAVRALRFEHPTIAAKFAWPKLEPDTFPVADNARFVYEVPASDKDVEGWLSQVVVTRMDAAEAARGDVDSAVRFVSHDLGRVAYGPQTTLFEMHFIPVWQGSSCGVVFRLGHALFDGIGSFQFLDMLNARIAQLLKMPVREEFAWGEEVARLTGAVPDRARVPWSPDKIDDDKVMLDKLQEALVIQKSLRGLGVPSPLGPPSSTGVVLRTMPPDSLGRLSAAARNHGCTVFSVLLAANILSLLRLRPPSDPNNSDIAIYPSAVDLRARNLRDGASPRGVSNTIGFHVYIVRNLGRFVHDRSKIDASGETRTLLDDLWTLGREVRKQVDEQRRYMDRIGFWGNELMEVLGHFTAAARARDKQPEERIANLSPLPNLSSLGIVDGHLSPSHKVSDTSVLTISSPRFSSRIPYNPSVIMHPYTWQGTLYVPFSFPEGYMGSNETQGTGVDAQVLNFTDEFMKILKSASEDGAMCSSDEISGKPLARIWRKVSRWAGHVRRSSAPLASDVPKDSQSGSSRRTFRLSFVA